MSSSLNPPRSGKDPLRMAVIGCGAATRLYAAPALERLERDGHLRVTRLFDPSTQAVDAVRDCLRSARPATSLEVALEEADLALIASPSALHARQSVIALERGLHVFCEKPMATSVEDADRVLAAAEASGRTLGIGLIRRHLPATRAIKELLANEAIGTLRTVSWFEGGPFAWPVGSPGYFTRAQSGGGVLQDIGTHGLDLLGWWLGPPEVVSYADDAMGGVEANAALHLRCGTAEVRMRLSRDWARPNRVVLTGERGDILWEINEPDEILLRLTGARPARLVTEPLEQGPMDFVSAYGTQIRDMIDAILSNGTPVASGRAGREVCALVETCYRTRTLIDMAWMSPHETARAARMGDAP